MPLFSQSPYKLCRDLRRMLAHEPSQRTQALVVLEKLCAELFDADGLRRWVAGNLPPEVENALPGASVSAAELFHKFVLVLERQKLVEAVTTELLQVRGKLHADGQQRLRATSSHVPDNWRRRYTLSRAFTLVLVAVWLLTRAYPTLDVSRALMGFERSVLGFLPISYKGSGLLGVTFLSAVCTVLLWTASRGAERRS